MSVIGYIGLALMALGVAWIFVGVMFMRSHREAPYAILLYLLGAITFTYGVVSEIMDTPLG